MNPFLVRGTYEPVASAGVQHFDSLQAAINYTTHPAAEPLIVWGKEHGIAFAAADGDFHHLSAQSKPDARTVDSWIDQVQPTPLVRWRTHGGGGRAIFAAHGDLTASEWAALWCVNFRQASGGMATCEVKTECRHPAYPRADGRRCGPVEWCRQSSDLGAVAAVLAGRTEVDEAERDAWLEERGHSLGSRAGHDECPIDPRHPSDREPVMFGEFGIFCHSCRGRDMCFPGCRTAGFVPWSKVLPGTNIIASPLRTCVENFTHWAHARYVVSHCIGIEGSIAELVYGAMLKLWHLHKVVVAGHKLTWEKLITRCFYPPIPLVRGPYGWTEPNFVSSYEPAGLESVVASLPGASYVAVSDDGKTATVKRCPLRFGMLRSKPDLADYGYQPVHPLRGYDMNWRWRQFVEEAV